MRLIIGGMNVQRIERTSGVYSGRNIQLARSSVNRVSEGFGTVSGDGNEMLFGVHGYEASSRTAEEAYEYGGEKGCILQEMPAEGE